MINLKLPFFIGSVNSKDSTISLYTTYRLSQIAIEHEYRKLSLHMQEVNEIGKVDGERRFNIGPPLLKWGFTELQSAEFRMKTYQMLKTVIESEERNLKHRSIKYMESIDWRTNDGVTPGWHFMTGSMLKDETPHILQEMAPYVSALSMQYMASSTKDADDIKAVLSLVAFMARHQVNIIPLIGGMDESIKRLAAVQKAE